MKYSTGPNSANFHSCTECNGQNGSWVFGGLDGCSPRKVSWTLDKVF